MGYRVLVVGADSLIGSALTAYLRNAGETVISTTRRPGVADGGSTITLDLAGDNIVTNQLPDVDIVYLCAAMTRFADCEAAPVLAEKINVLGIAELGRHYLRRGSFVIFLSSNAVFSGATVAPGEDEIPNPVTTYGKQKYAAEQLFLNAAREANRGGLAIVRLTKVLPADFPLLMQWRTALRKGESIRPFSDLTLCPVSLPYAVGALSVIGDRLQSGTFHLSGQKDISYGELAFMMAQRWGLEKALVNPAVSSELGIKLQWQPRYSSLGMTTTSRIIDIKQQSLEDVIEEVAIG